MRPESNPITPELNQAKLTKSGAPHIAESQTPKLPTDPPETALHDEAHRYKEIEFVDEIAAQTRQEIIEHYQIDPHRVISLSGVAGEKREMRAFSILEKRNNPQDKYYADGHTAHAILLNTILNRFPEIGVPDRLNIPDDFFDKWTIKKGFIDPRRNGFKNFEVTHAALQKLLLQNQKINGLNSEQVAELEKNNQAELPNWFRTG